MQKEAGFHHPGTFPALLESPKHGEQTFGFDYLKSLGITHIQLLPLYDFGSVDETNPAAGYNWGYDPVQYNVPEGSFCTQPNDPYQRIIELQQVIDAYHEADISLIMDVVYNHVYLSDDFAFERIVPGYFYRYDQNRQRTNGTFCGNDVASERAMVRNYIKQSVKQWVQLYGFDGFRFDLMGILDHQTMMEIQEELTAIYPNIYLYGEGWKMDTGLEPDLLAHQYNAEQLRPYGFFSDNFRDTIKRSILNEGRVDSPYQANDLANVLTANIGCKGAPHFVRPQQAINYVECHDNATFYDYLKVEDPTISPELRHTKARLGLHLVLLAQGVPFLHAGQEFYRSKGLEENTYNLPDSLNQLDWLSSMSYETDIQFLRELIAYRKKEELLRLVNAQAIRDYCQVTWTSVNTFSYSIEKDGRKLLILVNLGDQEWTYRLKQSAKLAISYPHVYGREQELSQEEFTIPAHGWILVEQA